MLPGLNLDSLNRHKKKPERCEEGVPGRFSPRPTHARSLSDWNSSLEPDAAPLPSSLTASPEGFARTTAAPALAYIEKGVTERRERPLRSSPPKTTLLEHQQARSSVTDASRSGSAITPRERGGGDAGAHGDSSAARVLQPELLEAYVAGRTWSRTAGLEQWSPELQLARGVTAFAVSGSGDYVAMGEASGRIAVMRRDEGVKSHEGEKDHGGNKHESGPNDKGDKTVRKPYNFVVGRQAYTSVIDPLNSVEVTPNVRALCFLPQVSPTTYLLTSNEKLPKLYKVISVRESPSPFAVVDRLGAKSVGSLTLNPPHGSNTVAMKEVTRYALNHEYNINSLCPLTDSHQFFSADDLTVKLWCIEYPDTSIETYSLRPPFDEEPRETICGIHTFPHEPFLLFVVTSSGTVRVVDTRQTLKWLQQSPLVFNNTFCEENGVLTNSQADCALSPCGRYVAGRDLMSVCLWDSRRASLRDHMSRPASMNFSHIRDEKHEVVRRWELFPQLRLDLLEELNQIDSPVRFTLRFLNNCEVVTGGFASMLYVLNILDGADSSGDGVSSQGGMAFELPRLVDKQNMLRGPLPSFALEDVDYMSVDPDRLFGSLTTQLSHPLTSASGDCSVMASCGPAVFQLAYKYR